VKCLHFWRKRIVEKCEKGRKKIVRKCEKGRKKIVETGLKWGETAQLVSILSEPEEEEEKDPQCPEQQLF